MKSVLIRPPASANSIRPRCVKPRLPPSADHAAPQLVARRRASRRSRGRRRRAFVSRRRLHVRADAAVVEQVDRRAQDRRISSFGVELLGVDPERSRASRRDRDRLRRCAATRRRPREIFDAVVVVPAGRRAARTGACARRTRRPGSAPGRRTRGGGRTRRRGRSGSSSSIPLPNTSPDMSPMPTTVNGSFITSVPISRKWRLTDSHAPRAVIAELLVVVAGRAPRRERVAEPEPVLGRDRVRRVGERRGALVRRDAPVGVVLVVRPRRAAGWTTAPSRRLSVMSSRPRMNVMYCRVTSSLQRLRVARSARLSTNPPLEPVGTITAFLTICAFISPRTSVR